MYTVKFPINTSNSKIMGKVHKIKDLRVIKMVFKNQKAPYKDQYKMLYLVGPKFDFNEAV